MPVGDVGIGQMNDLTPMDWWVHVTADNATATATKAADSRNRDHYIGGIIAGFSGAATKDLTLTIAGVTFAIIQVANQQTIIFDRPIRCAGAFVAALAASGTGANLGRVTVFGYTR